MEEMELTENELLIKRVEELSQENEELKKKLKKYTAPSRNKRYYENNKEKVNQRVNEYRERVNYKPPQVSKEKRKKYNKRYNEKKKLEKQEAK